MPSLNRRRLLATALAVPIPIPAGAVMAASLPSADLALLAAERRMPVTSSSWEQARKIWRCAAALIEPSPGQAGA